MPAFQCWCTGVTDRDLVEALAHGCPATVEDLRRTTGACSGCRSCRPELAAFLAGLAPTADTREAVGERPRVPP